MEKNIQQEESIKKNLFFMIRKEGENIAFISFYVFQ